MKPSRGAINTDAAWFFLSGAVSAYQGDFSRPGYTQLAVNV